MCFFCVVRQVSGALLVVVANEHAVLNKGENVENAVECCLCDMLGCLLKQILSL